MNKQRNLAILLVSMLQMTAIDIFAQPIPEYMPYKMESSLPSASSHAKEDIEPLQVTFEPVQRAILASQISSTVTKITKYLGEEFKTNDLLIQLDDTFYKANVEKGQAAFIRAKAALHAKQKLYKDSIASFFDVKDAEAALAQANAELALAQKQLDSCSVLAPFNGRVASLLIAEAELPQQGQPLIEVVGNEALLGKMLIDAMMWDKVAIDQTLNIKVVETGKTVQAKIIRIGPMIDLASSTIKVEALVERPDYDLFAGMTGTTTLDDKLETNILHNKPEIGLSEVDKTDPEE